MLRVGLTGGIASGKTRVLRRFAQAGLRTVDLDQVSREVMAPGGAAHAPVSAAFGPAILRPDGTIDRVALGGLVFADVEARRQLESIVHPLIRAAENDLLAGTDAAAVVVDAALLIETGAHLRFDRMVVVYCEPREQLRRLMARDGIPEEAARARIDAQMPADQKRVFAHFLVDASEAPADTDARADEVMGALRELTARSPSTARVSPSRGVALMERGPRKGPRGLTAWGVAERMSADTTLDLAQLSRALQPAHAGPWYTAPDTTPADERPETLAVPLAIWCAGRRPGDLPFTVSAAASLARLTHRDTEQVAGAIVAALAAQHALVGEGTDLRQGLRDWIAAAKAWTGSAPSSSVVHTVLAAASHPGDAEQAAREAQLAGGTPALARAFAGGATPFAPPSAGLDCMTRILGPAAV